MTAISAPVGVGSAVSAAASTSVVLSVTTPPPRGALVFVATRFNATEATGTITDSAGNTYATRTQGGNEINGDCINLGDLTSGTITITGSASATVKIAIAMYLTGVNQSARFIGLASNVVFFNGTARNVGGATVTPQETGDAVIGLYSLDTTEAGLTAGAGYTVGPTYTGGGYYTSNVLSLQTVYQIVTVMGAKQPTATGTTSPTAYGGFAYLYRSAAPRNPGVDHGNPAFMFRALRGGWRRRVSGIVVPDLWLPGPAVPAVA